MSEGEQGAWGWWLGEGTPSGPAGTTVRCCLSVTAVLAFLCRSFPSLLSLLRIFSLLSLFPLFCFPPGSFLFFLPSLSPGLACTCVYLSLSSSVSSWCLFSGPFLNFATEGTMYGGWSVPLLLLLVLLPLRSAVGRVIGTSVSFTFRGAVAQGSWQSWSGPSLSVQGWECVGCLYWWECQ